MTATSKGEVLMETFQSMNLLNDVNHDCAINTFTRTGKSSEYTDVADENQLNYQVKEGWNNTASGVSVDIYQFQDHNQSQIGTFYA